MMYGDVQSYETTSRPYCRPLSHSNMETEPRLALISSTLKKLGIKYKRLPKHPFFDTSRVQGFFIVPGPQYRYPVSSIVSVYPQYLLVGTFSKNFNPLFTATACDEFLAKNCSEQFRFVQFNTVLHGVFTTQWGNLLSLDVEEWLRAALENTNRLFLALADEMDLTVTLANEWFLACELNPAERGAKGKMRTNLWENREKVTGTVTVSSRNEAVYVKMKVGLTKTSLPLVQTDPEIDLGTDLVQRVDSKKKSISLSVFVKDVKIVGEKLVAMRDYFRTRVAAVVSIDATQYTEVLVSEKPVQADFATLAKLIKPYKTLKFKMTTEQMTDFKQKVHPKVLPCIFDGPIKLQSENSYLSFEGKAWYRVGTKGDPEKCKTMVADWLFDLDFEFVDVPFSLLYYVKELGFRFIPDVKEAGHQAFAISEGKTLTKEDVIKLVFSEISRQLQVTDQVSFADIIADLPASDKIDFSLFENKNLASCIELGKGGFGTIYLNKYEKALEDGKTTFVEVALKVIKPEKLGKLANKDNLLQEYRILKTAYHKNVIKVHGYTLINGQLAIVMDYCKNKTLSKYIATDSSMPMHLKLKLLLGVANGLVVLHARNFVHLDLKPQNILIDGEGVPKISDLGLSKKIRLDSAISKAGYTLLYSAPEQVDGQAVDLSADIWAFGNVMYYVFFNKGPNEYLKDPSENVHSFAVKKSVVKAILEDKKKPLIPDRITGQSGLSDEVHGFEKRYPRLVDLMRMCWQLDVKARPTAQKLAKVLTKLYADERRRVEGFEPKRTGDLTNPADTIRLSYRAAEAASDKETIKVPAAPVAVETLTQPIVETVPQECRQGAASDGAGFGRPSGMLQTSKP